jgi:hypothetical protein
MPEKKPARRPNVSVRLAHKTPIGPTGAAMTKPTISPLKKNVISIETGIVPYLQIGDNDFFSAAVNYMRSRALQYHKHERIIISTSKRRVFSLRQAAGASERHGRAQNLPHGEGAQDKTELWIRLPEEFHGKPEHAVQRDEERRKYAGSANPVFRHP